MDVPLDDLPVRPDGLIFTAEVAAMDCGHRLPRLLRAGRVASRLTSPAHTIAQRARQAPLAAALVAAAAALRDLPYSDEEPMVTLEEPGCAPAELQHRIWLPGLRRHVWVDFYGPELDIAMEADSEGKYLDAGSTAGAARRVVREKRREDQIRRQVNAFGGWGWERVWQRQPLERILTRVGVARTGPRRCLRVA